MIAVRSGKFNRYPGGIADLVGEMNLRVGEIILLIGGINPFGDEISR